jgi:drug/metabolite transporter (DMT)-like permease
MLLLVLIAPLLFATTGVIDTYFTKVLTQKQKEGILSSSVATLMIIGGIVSLFLVLVLFAIFRMEVFFVSLVSIGSLMLSGVFRGLASIPYFKALKGSKIENITPFFQTIPLFAYCFANLALGETLTPLSIVLMVAIVIVSGLFMWDFEARKVNWKGVFQMLLSSLLYGLFYVAFKF